MNHGTNPNLHFKVRLKYNWTLLKGACVTVGKVRGGFLCTCHLYVLGPLPVTSVFWLKSLFSLEKHASCLLPF